MNTLLSNLNPWVSNSAALDSPSSPADKTAAVASPGSAAVAISESAASLPALVERTDAAGDCFATAPAAFSETQYKPETFLEHARRRSMPIISPPLPRTERDIDSIALNAVGAALNLHPRDLDLDPLFKLGQTP